MTDSYAFTAFGVPVATSGATVNPHRYIGALGYYTDPATGLAYVRARYLGPATGSWLSVDPVASEPRYQYVGGRATRAVDASGRISPEEHELHVSACGREHVARMLASTETARRCLQAVRGWPWTDGDILRCRKAALIREKVSLALYRRCIAEVPAISTPANCTAWVTWLGYEEGGGIRYAIGNFCIDCPGEPRRCWPFRSGQHLNPTATAGPTPPGTYVVGAPTTSNESGIVPHPGTNVSGAKIPIGLPGGDISKAPEGRSGILLHCDYGTISSEGCISFPSWDDYVDVRETIREIQRANPSQPVRVEVPRFGEEAETDEVL